MKPRLPKKPTGKVDRDAFEMILRDKLELMEQVSAAKQFLSIARMYWESGSIESSPPGSKDFGYWLEITEDALSTDTTAKGGRG